jgi:hypothetical protein
MKVMKSLVFIFTRVCYFKNCVKILYPACYFFCGKKVTKKAAPEILPKAFGIVGTGRKGLHPLFGVVLLFRFSATVASALYRYS